ncbi:MAG: leucine-rich repeat protein [Clostridia bacterium]|nr:leucine-rich repeat protein [Clostridia bacterium]
MNKKIICNALAASVVVGSSCTALFANAAVIEQTPSCVSGKIYFDTGEWNSDNILFYIWDETTGMYASKNGWVNEQTWGQKKKIGGKKLDDGRFESYELDLTEGHNVFVIFHDFNSGAQTVDCVLTPDALGDTAKFTGDILQAPQDGTPPLREVRFENSGLTTPLRITLTGDIVGETILPNTNPAYEVAKFIFKCQGKTISSSNQPTVTVYSVFEAIDRFKTNADDVWAEYQAIKGTPLDKENCGYTIEKEKEAAKILGIAYQDGGNVQTPEDYTSASMGVKKLSDGTVELVYYSSNGNRFNMETSLGNKVASRIKEYAFSECENLESVKIPESVAYIGENAFSYCEEGSDTYKPLPKLTIYGYANSAAQKFAQEYGIPFKPASEYPGANNDQPGTKPTSLYGDIDGDSNITSADALSVLRASVGLEKITAPELVKAADIDLDGTLTSGDALAILRASVNLDKDTRVGKPI